MRGRSVSAPDRKPTSEAVAVARHMVGLASHPVCLVGPDGRLVAASPALSELLGIPPADVAGRHVRELITDGGEAVDETLTLWRGSSSWRPGALRVAGTGNGELHCRGARLPGTDLLIVEVTGQRPAVDDFVALSREVELENRRRMEARLQESLVALEAANQRLEAVNAELDRYASMVAHDIRTPFNAIARFADLVLDDHGDELPDDAEQMLGAIARLAGRGEEVTGALLALARTGEPELVPEGTDSDAVAERVRGDLEAMIAEAEAEVSVGDLPDTAVQVTHLERVLTNLLTNALKYAAEGRRPHVVVAGARIGDLVRFTVADNGRGIPGRERERIFEPLVRGADAADRPGTGVGLATCRKIVEAYGGSIAVVESGGEGATVAFTLPAAVPPGESPSG